MKELFIHLVVQPFYNALILLVDFVTSDLGVAMIILTIIFRLILFPLYRSQIKTQIRTQQIQGPLRQLQEKYKDNKEMLGKEMLELYRKNKVNPFSGILILLIQIPLLIGFYYVFSKAGLPEVNSSLIYSFVPRPEFINHVFLGIIDMTAKSIPLAIIVGITQYIQMRLIMPRAAPKSTGTTEATAESIMRNMQTQMIFVMPLMITFIGYKFGSIVALYILVVNIFSIGQELYIRKHIREPETARMNKENGTSV